MNIERGGKPIEVQSYNLGRTEAPKHVMPRTM